VTGGSSFQTINRFVVHQDREKVDPSRGTVRSKGSLRKDCMGLAVKKVLCRIVFGGNGARGSGATSKKPRRGEAWER
jgi:hypothetical protein